MRTAEKITCGEAVTLAFLGDSVTQGCFAFEHGHKGTVVKSELAFPNLLKTELEKRYGAQIQIVNAGVSGNYARDGLARLQSDVLDKHPDLCCVMFGTNDVTDSVRRHPEQYLQKYQETMRQIGRTLLSQGIEVIFLTPAMLCTRKVPGFHGFWSYVHGIFRKIQNSGNMDRYVQAEIQVAETLAIPVADAYQIWKKMALNGVDTTDMLANGMNHPTPEAHHIFKDALLQTIFEGYT